LVYCNSIFAQKAETIKTGQDTVFAFFEYKIKEEVGMEDAFNAGYERDLEWHKSQNDTWSWVGWYVANGNRRDRFIDATPNHTWSDFDNWKVNGSLNAKLNKIHWANYVENPTGSYKIILPPFSNNTANWFKSNSIQVYTIQIDISKEKVFLEFLNGFKDFLKIYLKDNSFVWMKTASGGNTNEYQLFVCLNKKEQMELVSKIFNATVMPNEIWKSYAMSVISNTSEMWGYEPTMSLYPEGIKNK
jgi:hypothetical protein